MILGVGLDLVAVTAFSRQLDDPASAFAVGTFTDRERQIAHARHGTPPAVHLAGRFAAKEAFIKAWSTARFGLAPALDHIDLREVEVIADPHRRPALITHGAVAIALAKLGATRLHLSISHDGDTAAAVVILEQLNQRSTP